MRDVGATGFFRVVSTIMGAAGALLAAGAVLLLLAPAAVAPGLHLSLVAGGALPLLIGLAWPLRIGLSDFQLPAEVKRTMVVVGASLAVAGTALLGAGMVGGSGWVALALAVCAACALGAAHGGFYWLSKRLPAGITIGELASIAVSAGILGKREDSIADRELMRWSRGIRAGVPVGQSAPDSEVVTLDGEVRRLAELFAEGGAGPLVLNLGSYTCPHHRRRVDELHALMDRWESKGVRLLTVYTAEAHPEDGWRLDDQYAGDEEYTGNPQDFCFFQARELGERIHMARWLSDKKGFRMPVVVDTMENAALSAYNSWPIRLYVVRDGKVAFTGEQGPFGYAPAAVDAALQAMLG